MKKIIGTQVVVATTALLWLALLGTIVNVASADDPKGCEPHWDGIIGQPGMDAFIFALEVFDDGNGPALFAGGSFTIAGGQSMNSIAKWGGPSDGWLPVGEPFNGAVLSLAVFDDGSGTALYAGGTFTHIGSMPVNHVARWDGSKWSALAADPLNAGVGGHVRALAAFDDGSGSGPAMYVGGTFTLAGGQPANHIAKWDGAQWSPLGLGVQDGTVPHYPQGVRTLAVYDDNSGSGPALYVGGNFMVAGGRQAHHIARWDGTQWTSVGGGTNGIVRALITYHDGHGEHGRLYVGGKFSSAGSQSAFSIARWNGVSWLNVGSGISGTGVHAFAVFDDQSGNGPALYVGGNFPTAGALVINHIAKFSGDQWSPLSAGTNLPAFAFAALQDASGGTEVGPTLFVGGQFYIVDGAPAMRIASWRGCAGPKCAPGDLDCDGSVGVADLLILLASWGECPDCRECAGDLTGDCNIGVGDLLILLANWG